MTDNITERNIEHMQFIRRLHRIDLAGLTQRDVMILYMIITTPGLNGVEIAHKIGLDQRSSVSFGYSRMVRRGLIEDRRSVEGKGVPSVFFITDKGLDFWNKLMRD